MVPPGDWILRGGLQIRFGQRELKRVSRSYIGFWLADGDPVRRSSLLDTDPLRLAPIDVDDEILQVRLISMSRREIGLSITPMEATQHIEFEVLDRGDGAILEVLHVGDRPVELLGSIPGTDILKPRLSDMRPRALRFGRQPWYKRLRFDLFPGRLSPFPGIAPAIILAVSLIFVAIAAGVLALSGGNPGPLDPSKYALSTVEGQQAFATDVRMGGDGLVAGAVSVIVVAAILCVLALLLIFLRARFLVKVPRSVLTVDLDPEFPPGTEYTEAEIDRLQAQYDALLRALEGPKDEEVGGSPADPAP